MKNNKLDNQIKKSLQEQAELFGRFADTDSGLETILSRLRENKMEENKMKHFNMKKAVISTVAAVIVLGTIAVASGKVTTIVSHSLSFPEYTKYADLSKAEARAGVISDAPEKFSNGYQFYGINIESIQYENEDNQTVDSFQSLSIQYQNGTDRIYYDVQPRPVLIENADTYTDIFEQEDTTYYYLELRNKWVPVGYEPTDEEREQMDAGTLNIGIGASEISYSDSKKLIWEKNGHEHSLFCMDNDISKEALISMALEIQE